MLETQSLFKPHYNGSGKYEFDPILNENNSSQ